MMKDSPSVFRAACVSTLVAAVSAHHASAVTEVPVFADANTRVVSGTTNSRDDNNGGADSSLIGINTGGIDNFVIWGFNAGFIAGDVQGDATLTVNVAQGFSNANHGTTADTIWIRELYASNAGWLEGGQAITGSDNESDMGWASFLNRVQYNDDPGPASGTTEPWMDAGGAGVPNLLGAVGPNIATTPGYDVSATTPSISFTIPQATMQAWVDNGVAGLVLGNDDDGDSRSRFNFTNMVITYDVPDVIPGDTDNDGDVDDTDLGVAISSFTGPLDPGTGGQFFYTGDTDGDGDVDDTDLGVAISGFTGPLATPVPEPASLALLTLGGRLATRRRRA